MQKIQICQDALFLVVLLHRASRRYSTAVTVKTSCFPSGKSTQLVLGTCEGGSVNWIVHLVNNNHVALPRSGLAESLSLSVSVHESDCPILLHESGQQPNAGVSLCITCLTVLQISAAFVGLQRDRLHG
jgi:hypothetical protein